MSEKTAALLTEMEKHRLSRLLRDGGMHEWTDEDITEAIGIVQARRAGRVARAWIKEQAAWLTVVLGLLYFLKDHVIAFLEGFAK